MFRRLRTYLSRMFLPHLYSTEGFRLTNRKYVTPSDTIDLPAKEKRAITICNLFANEHQSIDEIAQAARHRPWLCHFRSHSGTTYPRQAQCSNKDSEAII